jgi:hypothetical protein
MKPREKVGTIPNFLWKRIATHFLHENRRATLPSRSRAAMTGIVRIRRRAAGANVGVDHADRTPRNAIGAGVIRNDEATFTVEPCATAVCASIA